MVADAVEHQADCGLDGFGLFVEVQGGVEADHCQAEDHADLGAGGRIGVQVGARLDAIAGPSGNHLEMLCQHLLTCDEPPRMF